MSSEKFIANPFAQEDGLLGIESGSRLYRTGDLGRYLEDGNIEYIGRIDEQVKIRGYRIELGEIENSLSSYEGIKQSVVIVKEHKEGEAKGSKYVVGYYVSDKELDEEDILSHMGSMLPEYMIPNVIKSIEEIPLTINGKVDKKNLPEVELVDTDKYVAPRDEIEERLSEIWSKVLVHKIITGLLYAEP
jgi:acyl-coenzyme A synthetase/AMP-(fatty) acid ligase